MVSIILPTYNGAKYLKESIKSCLNQTYKDIELIIVDDCSTDDIQIIIKSFNDSRVKYIRNQENQGIAESLNIGFKNSTGDYLTWTSDDNYYEENAIETLLQNIKGYDFVYSNYTIINKGVVKAKHPFFLNYKNVVGACFLYTREVYQKIGNFKKEHLLAEDYEYWLRVKKSFKMKNIDQNLYFYRLHSNSLTGQNKKYKIAKAAYNAAKQYVCPGGVIFQYLKMIYHKIR